VNREIFEQMKSIHPKEFDELPKQGGSPPKLSVEDKLSITLKYLREYRTMESIGSDYGVSKSRVSETIQWVEDRLIRDETFKLPGKEFLSGRPQEIQGNVVEVT
jgi:hypothetical protein